jgi:hypothetical protein
MWYFKQVYKALSRLLNAMTGGEGDTTFSAYSYYIKVHSKTALGARYGAARVWLLDKLHDDGHCLDAYVWHRLHRLFEIDK